MARDVEKLESVRKRISERLVYGEDLLYLVSGALLAMTALWLLGGTMAEFVEGVRSERESWVVRSIDILDVLLLVLMLVELMHTIRVSLETHSLVPEPFLIVALIAGVRRVLILTTEASQYIRTDPEMFRMALLELTLLTVFFLVVTFAIAWLRKNPPGDAEREGYGSP